MPAWVLVIGVNAILIMAFYIKNANKILREKDEQIKSQKETIKQLETELRTANKHIAHLSQGSSEVNAKSNNIPDSVLADDPMDAILRNVGRIDR